MERQRSTAVPDYAVGADGDCEHPRAGRSYLGNMGTAALHRCGACGGVLVTVLTRGPDG